MAALSAHAPHSATLRAAGVGVEARPCHSLPAALPSSRAAPPGRECCALLRLGSTREGPLPRRMPGRGAEGPPRAGQDWASGSGSDDEDEDYGDATQTMSRARQRRLEKTKQRRDERKKEQDRIFQEFSRDVASRYPEMMDLLEEEREGQANPQSAEELAQKVEERLKAKMGDWYQERTGSTEDMRVQVRQVDPFDLTIWIELHEKPDADQLDSLTSVFRAWYLVGKLGGYNATNLQMSESGDKILTGEAVYKSESAESALPAALHNISDLEFQGRLGRIWVDMGTAELLALDVLINALACFSVELE